MDLSVKLVLSPTAHLTVTPDDDHVSPSSNGIPLTWKRDGSGGEFEFNANSIGNLPDPPFSAPSYDPANNTITVIDHYTNAGPGVDYQYTLTVKAGMTPYSASGHPAIRNK